MKTTILFLMILFALSFAVSAQTATPTPSAKSARPPIFRANKEQIAQVQKMLKVSETGKLDDATRGAINARSTISWNV